MMNQIQYLLNEIARLNLLIAQLHEMNELKDRKIAELEKAVENNKAHE